ncbi:MAG: TatD family hydrolase [Alphaproteobacteria bacterium]|nr:TatD family hydrolase [Alphaproteobacteria bacterium]
MLVDSHCHLDFPKLVEDREGVLARAEEAGVKVMQTIGTKLSSFAGVLAIAEAYPNVWCSVGVHPHSADQEGPDSPDALLKHTDHPRVIGIGEAGLDYHYENSTPDNQAKGFRAHIEAARVSGLPLIVHTRSADDDTLAIMKDELKNGRYEAVIHCYSSSPDLGYEAVELGFCLGLGGILTFSRSDELRTTIEKIPLDRLLLETDAPYLTPAPFRKIKTNEPAYVAHVAAKLAEVKQVPVADIEAATTDNFFRLFSKAQRPKG